MALNVETSWSPYQRFHRTFTIDLTSSIVSFQSCVVDTTFVGNSVLLFNTSEQNYHTLTPFLNTYCVLLCPRSIWLWQQPQSPQTAPSPPTHYLRNPLHPIFFLPLSSSLEHASKQHSVALIYILFSTCIRGTLARIQIPLTKNCT